MQFLATLTLAASALAVTLPSQDAFYKQPENIASFQPGQVITSRAVPPSLTGFLGALQPPYAVDNLWQIQYRTTDAIGRPVAAVTSLIKPRNAKADRFIAYQQAYDSANNDCSPSYSIQAGSNNPPFADATSLTSILDKGIWITTSDYEGLLGQFTVGLQSGYATLDSVRATLNFAKSNNIGLNADARYAMWGYSGGALASEWASELQQSYAPELNFAGVALGGLTPNVTNVLFTINGGAFSGLAFSGIYGFIKAYPNLTEFANTHLIKEKSEEFYRIANGCLAATALTGGFKDLFTYADIGRELVNDPLPRSVLAGSGQMGVYGAPKYPVYIYKAVNDQISPVADTDYVYNTLCDKGSIVDYRRYVLDDHVTNAISGAPGAFAWVQDRLDGKAINATSCSRRDILFNKRDIPARAENLAQRMNDAAGGDAFANLHPLELSG